MDESQIDECVMKFGWHAITVADGPIPFMYTQGFIETLNHPELIVLGQDERTMGTLLGKTYDYIRIGKNIDSTGRPQSIIPQYDLAFLPVNECWHEKLLGWSMGYCRYKNKNLTVLQLFWPDMQDKFPFQGGCDDQVFDSQPQLQDAQQKKYNGHPI